MRTVFGCRVPVIGFELPTRSTEEQGLWASALRHARLNSCLAEAQFAVALIFARAPLANHDAGGGGKDEGESRYDDQVLHEEIHGSYHLGVSCAPWRRKPAPRTHIYSDENCWGTAARLPGSKYLNVIQLNGRWPRGEVEARAGIELEPFCGRERSGAAGEREPAGEILRPSAAGRRTSAVR